MYDPKEMDPVTVVCDTQAGPAFIHAWSEEDEWRTPTVGYYPPKANWRKLLGIIAICLGAPAVAIAAIMGVMWNSGAQNHQEGPKPALVITGNATIDPAPAPNISEDDRFIGLLVGAGQSILNRTSVIAGGHWVCSYMSQGHSAQDVVNTWDANPQSGEDPTQAHKANQDYVAAAIKAYCPQLA